MYPPKTYKTYQLGALYFPSRLREATTNGAVRLAAVTRASPRLSVTARAISVLATTSPQPHTMQPHSHVPIARSQASTQMSQRIFVRFACLVNSSVADNSQCGNLSRLAQLPSAVRSHGPARSTTSPRSNAVFRSNAASR
jgi:hypothetical protein